MGITSNFARTDISIYQAFAEAYQKSNGERSSLRVSEDSTQKTIPSIEQSAASSNTASASTEVIAQASISTQTSVKEEKKSTIKQPVTVFAHTAAPTQLLEKMVIDLATSHRAIKRQVQVVSICLLVGAIAMTTFSFIGCVSLYAYSASITVALLSVLLARLAYHVSTSGHINL